MTKKLRIRFVLFSMLVLILMQALIILFSAQRNYRNLVEKAETQITIIQEAYPEDANVDARYFVATIGRDERGNKLDLSHIRMVNKDQARNYVARALESGQDSGFLDTFRYRILRQPEGIRIIFLSRSHNLDALKNTVVSQLIFSGAAMGVMLIVVVGISFWVSRPVKRSYEKQQQFITSASHQLGTPLAVIKASTDILQMDDQENEWIQSIQKQVGVLTQMTRDITMLAKLDEPDNKLCRITFSVTDLAEDVAETFSSISVAEKKDFQTQIPENISYNGDENMIRHLLTILLDNSFKYCPEGGQINLSLCGKGKGISIAVRNTVSNPDPQSLYAIFDRFYRGESGKPGFGLGLSIAKSIVKCHKGKISATLAENNQIEITAILK